MTDDEGEAMRICPSEPPTQEPSTPSEADGTPSQSDDLGTDDDKDIDEIGTAHDGWLGDED